MPAYKDEKTGTWMARYTYKTWDGQKKQSKKRGFKTKREAVQWEREFLLKQAGNNEMTFRQFVDIYRNDRAPRLKESTADMKFSIVENRILPFFADMPLKEITSTHVLKWQNEMIQYINPNTGKSFSKSYLKTLHNQLSAIFNHAVRFYNLAENPARVVGNMGSEKEIQMRFWTLEEYKKFSEAMMDKPLSYYCFQVLYWCGLRLGEMLALTPDDIDFERKTISVNKTYWAKKGVEHITSPKTPKSVRTITMPDFLAEELKEYLDSCYDMGMSDRMFPVTKAYIEHEMVRGIRDQNLQKIRVHDLRHSHVSLLIDMGYSAVSIAERMGHESIDITYRYAHMFPSVQEDMASKLNLLKEGL